MAVRLLDGLLLMAVGALAALLLGAQGHTEWGAAAFALALFGAALA
jgi:hypothetical protein